jgi:hypothetical protein
MPGMAAVIGHGGLGNGCYVPLPTASRNCCCHWTATRASTPAGSSS